MSKKSARSAETSAASQKSTRSTKSGVAAKSAVKGQTKSQASKRTPSSSDDGGAKKRSKGASAGSSKTGTFDQLLDGYPDEFQRICRRLREIVYDVLPAAEETVWTGGWKLALYKDGSEICGIQPSRDHCHFYLTRGAEIPDPHGLMEGRGKGIRHVKIRTFDTIPEEPIRELIRGGRKLIHG